MNDEKSIITDEHVKEKKPRAVYRGTLPIGKNIVNCVVLDDERRILPAAAVFEAFDRPRKGMNDRAVIDGTKLPPFLAAKNLISLMDEELIKWSKPIEYIDGEKENYGYPAEIIPSMCGLYLRARREQKLTAAQQHFAIQAEILYESFAKIGIIALIDEATGFQKNRSIDALQLLLQQYVADGIKKWMKTFPDEFFLQLDRLYDKAKTSSRNRPPYYGKFINSYIYSPLEQGFIKRELDKRNITDEGRRIARFHQWLTDFGKDKLLIQLGRVMAIMEASKSIQIFRRKIEHQKSLSIAPELFDDLDDYA